MHVLCLLTLVFWGDAVYGFVDMVYKANSKK